MPVKIVASFNYKGGVTKTTSVINIGAKLAMDGRRVGLVDIDTQCNLSSCYLPEPMQAAENPEEDDDVELEQEEPQGEDADSPGIAQDRLRPATSPTSMVSPELSLQEQAQPNVFTALEPYFIGAGLPAQPPELMDITTSSMQSEGGLFLLPGSSRLIERYQLD
ncbi:hypothetical protein WJX77_004479 [Trebouxia sp. C0004]